MIDLKLEENLKDDISKDDIFDYLNQLKESGVTNMFAAPDYLVKEFTFSKATACAWVLKWMEEYKEYEEG